MKKLSILISFIGLYTILFAQAPEKMSYQAVIRNASNQLIASQPVGIRISILWGSSTGSSFYTETQTVNTNTNGLVSLEIGTGTVVSGVFSDIDWSVGPFFIQTEIDPTGGSSYTITGTSQLLTVPYAFFAEKSGDALTPAGNIGDMLYWDGNAWAVLAISGPGKTLKAGSTSPVWTNVPEIASGTSVGDMLYWNGTDWEKLPVGTSGQMLKLNGSNIPQWETVPNLGKTYVIIQGNITDAQAATQIAEELGPNTQFVWVQNTTALTMLDLSSISTLIELKINNNSALASINLNSLGNVTNVISVQNNPSLSSLIFPSLSSNNGSFDCLNNIALMSLSMPTLTTSKGIFNCNLNSALTSLSLPSLTTISTSFSCNSNLALASLSFSALTSITGNFSCFANVALTALLFPSLASTTGTFYCISNTALTSLTFPVLTTSGNFVCNSNNAMTTLLLPALNTINGQFMCNSNSSLNSLSLPMLATTTYVYCNSNPSLTTLSLPQLATIGSFNCESNIALTSISMPLLTTYTGNVFYVFSNALPSAQINALLGQIVSWGSTPVLNDIRMYNQTPLAPPSGSGVTDKATLISMGKSVWTD